MQTAIRKSTLLCVIGALAATVCSAALTILYATPIATESNDLATNSSQRKELRIAANPIDHNAAIDISDNMLPDEAEPPQRFSAKTEAARIALPAAQDEFLADKKLVADLAIEVDYEGFIAFGGSQQAVQTYVYKLIDAINTIYNREMNVRMRISFLRIATTPNDPWAATTTHAALSEVRKYWSANESTRARSAVLFLSGKKLGGGAAYIESACWYNYNAKDAYDFAAVGNMNGQFSTTRSDDNWDLVATAHELGHAFGSRHSHCTKRANGQWYDTCWSGESTCFNGTPAAMDGTLMSYCDKRGGLSKVMLSFADTSGDPAIINNIRLFSQRMVETNTAEGGCLKIEESPAATATPVPTRTPTPTPTSASPNSTEPSTLQNKIYFPIITIRYKSR